MTFSNITVRGNIPDEDKMFDTLARIGRLINRR